MGSGRITKKVGMSPCDTDAKQTLHEYVDQAGWSMRNGRHLDTSLVESSVARAGSSRISGASQSALRHLGKLGKRLPRARGTFLDARAREGRYALYVLDAAMRPVTESA